MAVPVARTRKSFAEYLEAEQQAVDRHEFHDGEILAMSGGTFRHSLVAANIVGELRQRLKNGPCRIVESNLRVGSHATRRYVYPDASIICGPPQFDPEDPRQTTILNPTVIIEVLSESTEAYDRGEKFSHYRRIPALREYLLVSQDRPLVESFLRQEDDRWLLEATEGLDATAVLRSLNVSLPLAEVFAGVEL